MARLTKLSLAGFRSVKDQISIDFPEKRPVVLVGENNAGKSNIVRALDLILGEMWPGSRQPEDHDFWNRNSAAGKIEIVVKVEGLPPDKYGNAVTGFRWMYDGDGMEQPEFRATNPVGSTYASNEMREPCVCVVIAADRRLSYQLSYSSKWTLLAKLMRKFHNQLMQDETRVERLKASFEDVKQIFNEVAEFAGFQGELKKQFADTFGGMSYGLHVDFSAYDPSNYFHSLRVQPEEAGVVRTFEELGTGQEQLLALAFAYAYAKAFFGGIVLVIEEPEAHLHPLAQQWLARQIREKARDGLQIVMTTHSPAFVNILGLEGLVLVSKRNGATTTKQLTREDLSEFCVQNGADRLRTRPENVLSFYAGSATQEILAGLFAKKIVLVEGLTESLALPIYLRKVKLDVTKEGIAIIPVMGKGNLAKWWRFFTAYDIPTFLTFDNDSADDANATKRKDALRTLGFDDSEARRLTAADDWRIGDSMCIFGKDFEETMRRSFAKYADFETEARQSTGDSKPLIARFVAEKLTPLSTRDLGWEAFRDFAKKLRDLSCLRTDDDIPF
jgi:putative ATP-dependent endonuclease of OLD family